MSEPRVAVIILNWNGLGDTLECLQALGASSYPHLDIIVLDNGSRQDPEAALRRFPEVKLLKSPVNLGFAGGNNRAAEAATDCDLILFLNNDTIPPPDMIEQMVRLYTQTPQIGLLGVRERLPDAPAGQPERLGAQWRALTCRVKWLYAPPEALLSELVPVDVVSGCAMMLSREIGESAGLFDEAFFAYWEDADLSLRVLEAGYRNYAATGTHVLHKSGRSTGGSGTNLTQLYLVCRGQALIMRKHARGLGKLVAPLRMRLSGSLAQLRGALCPGRRAEVEAKLRGFADGRRGSPPDHRYVQ